MSSSRVRIGPTWRSARVWAPALLALVVGGICAITASADQEVATNVLGLVTALLVLSTVGGIAHVTRSRAWLQVQEDGFDIEGREGTTSYRDAEVVGVALRQAEHHSQGEIHALSRRVRLRVIAESGTGWVEISQRYKVVDEDVVGTLVDRINADLISRAKIVLEQGGAAAGEGWRLARGALVLISKRGEEMLQLSDLAAVAVFDRKLCIWRRDETEPVHRLPLDAENNRVLHRLLDEEIGARPAEDRQVTGLGRMLFERGSGRTARYGLWLLAGFVTLVGVVVYLATPEKMVTVAIAVPSAAIMALIAYNTQRRRLRCHELGVVLRRLGGQSELHYANVESFGYQAVKQFYNGAYVGTALTLTFVPSMEGREQGAKKIRYSTSVTVSDDELDGLRDHISQVVGAKLLEQVDAGESAQWTADLILHPDGIEGRRLGLLGKKKERELVKFPDLMRFDLHEGGFRIYRVGETKPCITESVAAMNFFPGFMAFTTILARED